MSRVPASEAHGGTTRVDRARTTHGDGDVVASAGAGHDGSRLPSSAFLIDVRAAMRLQSSAGNAAVAAIMKGRRRPPPGGTRPAMGRVAVMAVQRSPGEIDAEDLFLIVRSAGYSYAWEFPVAQLDARVVGLLQQNPTEIVEIERHITAALSDDDGPRHERAAYLESPPVANDLRRDVIDWPARRALTRLKGRLDVRAAALRNTRLRYALEQDLEASGVAHPGEIAWRREIAALRGHPPVETQSMLDAARADRFEMALRVLEREAGSDPEPTGPVRTATLGRVIWDRYAATDTAPPELAGEELMRTHSSAFLAHWLPSITSAQFVPEGFNLAAFRPTEGMDPVRAQILDRFIYEAAPQSLESYLLNRWVSTPGVSPDQFLRLQDIGELRTDLLEHLTQEFMRWAPTQPGWRQAFWSDVGQRAAFGALSTVVTAGSSLQAFHATLPGRFAEKGPADLTEEEYAIASDPFAYRERVANAAAVTSALIARLRPGQPLEADLTAWHQAVAAAYSPNTDEAQGAAALLTLFHSLAALKTTIEEQQAAAREQIAANLDTSYERIAAIVRSEVEYAQDFLQTRWVPMLKAVALEFVTRNRDEMREALANWPQYREQAAAKFRICAHVLDDLIRRLESGEVEAVEFDGTALTAEHLSEIRTARDFMFGQARVLTNPEQAEEKRNEMEQAVEGFEMVRRNIESGEYEPLDYSQAVYDEARRRLGIEWYESFTTLHAALSRWAVVPENPFLAYAIARWQWEERVRTMDRQFAVFLGLGLLTVASVVAPGAAGLVLLGVDLAVSIGMGIAAVDDAYDLLALARLDPEGHVGGVTVEMAEQALHTAWIGLGLSVVIAAGIGALWGRLLWRGRGAAQVPAQLTRLNALMQANPVAAERLIARIGNLEKLEQLLTTTGDAVLLERMMARTGDVRHLEYILMHGEPGQIAELLDLATDAATLGRIFDHVPDIATANRLLRLTDDAAELAVLVREVGNPRIVEDLLRWAPSTAEASRLSSLAGDGTELWRLSRHYSPEATRLLLQRAESAAQLNRLLIRVPPERLPQLLETTGDAGRLEQMVARSSSVDALEAVLAQVRATVPDAARLERLLDKAETPERLARWLEQHESAEALEAALEIIWRRVPDAAQRARLMATVERPGSLAKYLERVQTPAQLERLLGETARSGVPSGLTSQQWSEIGSAVRREAARFGSDIRAQGSRAAGVPGATSDLDLAILVDEARYQEILIQRFRTTPERIAELRNVPEANLRAATRNATERSLWYSIHYGKIARGELGLSRLGNEIAGRYGLPKVDLSVILRGSPLDVGPWVPLL